MMALVDGWSMQQARDQAVLLADRVQMPFVLFMDTNSRCRMERLVSAPWMEDWLFVGYPNKWKGEVYSLSWKDRVPKPEEMK